MCIDHCAGPHPPGSNFMQARLSQSAVVFCLLCTSITAGRPASHLQRFEFSQPHMGTTFRIALYAPDEETAWRASQAAFEYVARLDSILSDYRATSELMLLCQKAGSGPIKVGVDLFRILSISQAVATRTGGAFDVTAGPIIQLWRRARRTGEVPGRAKLARALALTGYRKLHLDPGTQEVQLDLPGMQLDLGGIAKGYAADKAIALLKAYGVRSALVAAGGDIVVGLAPPGEKGWRVSILQLSPDDKSAGGFLLIHDAAVSTSGDAEQFVEIEGVRYSHIVDPRTGLAVTGHSSVTVVARDGTTADAAATAVSVLGPTDGLEFIERERDAAAFIIKVNDEGALQKFFSKGWVALSKAPRGSMISVAPRRQ